MEPSLSLYIHIPFCRHRCSYCDFNTYTSLSDLKDTYTEALCAEIRQVAGDQRRAAHTIFFGGGTPSLMPATTVVKILETVQNHFQLNSELEVTLEANPGTVNRAYLAALNRLGVNRLSFGAQSAQATELALLGREHGFGEVVAAVQAARNAGIHNLNLDLIYGLPGQTITSWNQTLEAVLALEPTHLSLYCLIIEPGTPMQRRVESGEVYLPEPDLVADQYEWAKDKLAKVGFGHYEISNWALAGYECRHNLTYWRNHDYLGFGAGAHGHADGYRYQIVKQPRTYIRRMTTEEPRTYPHSAAVAESHWLTRQESMSDTMITQLRLLQEGLDLPAFAEKFGETVEQAYNGTVAQMIEWGLLSQTENNLRLTNRGTFLSNQLFYRFV